MDAGYYRVDTGEYRIVYRFNADEDLVEVILVGKRNDDEVYKQLSAIVRLRKALFHPKTKLLGASDRSCGSLKPHQLMIALRILQNCCSR